MTSSGRVSETMGLEEALPSQVRGGCASAMVVEEVVVMVMFGVADCLYRRECRPQYSE